VSKLLRFICFIFLSFYYSYFNEKFSCIHFSIGAITYLALILL